MASTFACLRPTALILASIAALGVGPAGAQQSGQTTDAAGDDSSLVLHATVHRVLVDVVVLDAHDRPVLSL